jgi:ABC-type Mn2+/Zn2+ transport system ATPase subunit
MTGRDDTNPVHAAQPVRAGQSCILDVVNLTVLYASRCALRDVSFSLRCGERVAVVGPNGAGKTTLFKAIAGLITPASGDITVHGHQPGVGLCVAYVRQRRNVDWSFPVSVADVVMMGRYGMIGPLRRPSEVDRTRVSEALGAVGLLEVADRQIGELSGGQQQRMFIARALAQEAELVLMDEPLTGLDIRSRDSAMSVMDLLRDQGVGLMVATHDLKMAVDRFDSVMLLNQHLVGFGSPNHVLSEHNILSAFGGGSQDQSGSQGSVILDVGQ